MYTSCIRSDSGESGTAILWGGRCYLCPLSPGSSSLVIYAMRGILQMNETHLYTGGA